MMRQTIWMFILLAIAGVIAFGSHNYPGTAEFVVAGFKISMSIYVFGLLFLGLIAVILLLWRMYRAVVNVPSRFGSWRSNKRENRALAAVKTATIALHEGRWTHADKAAKIASRSPQSAGIAALLGAASAHAQAQPITAQEWLKELEGDDDFADAAALQQAQIALANQDASAALAALDGASPTVRKHSVRYRELLIAAHAQADHWHEVMQIAKDKKWQAPLAVKNDWFRQASLVLCADASSSTSYLQSLYKDMPDDVRLDDVTLGAYISALLQRDEKVLASRSIEEAMRVSWRPQLLSLYVQASEESSQTQQLKALDDWEVKYPNDATLLCAAGELCLKAKIWGRAKANFQNSLAVKPSVVAHYGLAQTYRALADEPHAQEEERKAAALAVG